MTPQKKSPEKDWIEKEAYRLSLSALRETRACHDQEVKRFKNKESEWPAYHIEEALIKFARRVERRALKAAEKIVRRSPDWKRSELIADQIKSLIKQGRG